jgi:hypothetical protein
MPLRVIDFRSITLSRPARRSGGHGDAGFARASPVSERSESSECWSHPLVGCGRLIGSTRTFDALAMIAGVSTSVGPCGEISPDEELPRRGLLLLLLD